MTARAAGVAWRRRGVLRWAAAGVGGALAGCAAPARAAAASPARVLVVGAGYGGATAAKYLRLLSNHTLDVLLVEPEAAFVSCPMSNLVVAGAGRLADITRPFDSLVRVHGVRLIRDRVAGLDLTQRLATLASGARIRYDKLVLAPGVEMMWDEIDGLRAANQAGRILHAWKAGPETAQLRRQLESMPDGGVYAIAIPEAPYRCPPAPYERASLVADYFQVAKPRAKVLILDANEEIASKGAQFQRAWDRHYPGMVEYRPQYKASAVDAAGNTLKFEIQDDVRADVLNVLPPMRAGAIAVASGLANSNARWCQVRFLNFESTVARHVHVIGDSIQVASGMPKSGHMANSQAKVVAAALVAELAGWEIDPDPVLTSTCYSFVDPARAMHIASVHTYASAEQSFEPVHGIGDTATAPSALEAGYARSWAQSIWADMLS